MKKLSLKLKKKSKAAPSRSARASSGSVDETTLRTAWMAEAAVCLVVSLSAVIVAMVY